MYEQDNLRSKMVEVAYCQEQLLGNSDHAELQALYQDGWQVLINSADNNLTQKYHYRAVAFVNESTLEVHVAHAGTLVINFYDLWDDVKLLLNQIPSKLEPLKFFVNQMIGRLGGVGTALYYTFSSSGHSLGAILSDLMAAELMSRGLLFNQSSTFKNPGSDKVVECAIKKNCLSGQVLLQAVQLHYHKYNAKRTFINTFKSYLGDVIQLVKLKKNSQAIVGLPGTRSFSAKIRSAKLIEFISQHKLSDFRNISTQNTFSTTCRDNPNHTLHDDLPISSPSVMIYLCGSP